MSERSLVVSGSLQRHQVRQYLDVADVDWEEFIAGEEPKQSTFTILRATDEQWDRIQAWVKKVTG